MTPPEAFDHVIGSIDGLEIGESYDGEVEDTLLRIGTAICAIAVLRLDPDQQERAIQGIAFDIRNSINPVLARRAASLAAANGHGNGHV
jgi:hypothetical protein